MSKEINILSDKEVMKRAISRAKNSLRVEKADMGVGFAEGIIKNRQGVFTSAWCAIATANNKHFLGGGLHLRLSEDLLEKLYTGVLVEKDIEDYLQQSLTNPFEKLVEYAMMELKSKPVTKI